MTPYFRNYGGTYTITNYAANPIVTNTFLVTRSYEYLTCPEHNNGNGVLPTAYNYTYHRDFYTYGLVKMTGTEESNKNFFTVFAGRLESSYPVPIPWDNRTAAYNTALGRLNDSVRGSLDLSVALGEAHTTVRMIKNLAKLVKFAKFRMPPGGFGSARDVANGYLQYKYGWKPLISDIFRVADESIRITLNSLQKFYASARMPMGVSSVVYYPGVHNVPNVLFERETLVRENFQGCRIGVSLMIPEDAFQLNRWTSLNPLSLAWELMPYSFVIDWCVDVGSYLRNLETAMLYNVTFQSGYVSEIFRYRYRDKCENFQHHAPPYHYALNGISASVYHTQFVRTKLLAYPFPRLPSFDVSLNSGQLFSAAALLTQLLYKKKATPAPRTSPGGRTDG
jgi:hypothetical protein